ncbi:MAG: glycogen synthase GlgA [Pseudomonadales bacterium]|nr:glycogen synthase GlgA [Pseudomonadales bacterium]
MTGPRILFVSSEVAPLVKTGGLADVSAALPKMLAELGCAIRILMPAYGDLPLPPEAARVVYAGQIAGHAVEVHAASFQDLPPLWLVRCDALFGRTGNPYLGPDGRDWPDNADRFALLARTAATLALQGADGFRPDVLHLNDWQTGLAAALLADRPERPGLVFTIHNLNFQGNFPYEWFGRLALPPELATMDRLEFHGQLSFIKGGIVHADAITTVSPTYAREICTPALGAGLDGLLRHRAADLTGIVNGIDPDVWNPATDPLIHTRYDLSTVERKGANKRALRAAFDLPTVAAPLLGMVSRLTEQKGIDLVLECLPCAIDEGAQLVVLGSGERHFEQALVDAAGRHPRQLVFVTGYDERLAHRIEAGADMFLMPSRFEPCGLNQMYSMVYGTPPIVHRTGGLADTVHDPDDPGVAPEAATGFVMDAATPVALEATLRRALGAWRKPMVWRELQANGMRADFSWRPSAERYLEIYRRVARRSAGAAS